MTTTVKTRKTCFKCGVEQPIMAFYVHPRMKDGHLNKCKSCARRDSRENYSANAERYRAYDRARGYRPADAEKTVARNAVNHAIYMGRLVRGSCEMTGTHRGRIEAHHDDYSKPLQVRWLCKRHHGEVHTQPEKVA